MKHSIKNIKFLKNWVSVQLMRFLKNHIYFNGGWREKILELHQPLPFPHKQQDCISNYEFLKLDVNSEETA